MKKRVLLSSLVSITVAVSPLVLIGCQATEGLFGHPVNPQGPQAYHQVASTASHHRSTGSSSSAHEAAVGSSATKTVHHAAGHSHVPVEPPSVNSSSSDSEAKASSSSSSASSNSSSSATVAIPAASIVAPATAPAMAPPTVGQ